MELDRSAGEEKGENVDWSTVGTCMVQKEVFVTAHSTEIRVVRKGSTGAVKLVEFHSTALCTIKRKTRFIDGTRFPQFQNGAHLQWNLALEDTVDVGIVHEVCEVFLNIKVHIFFDCDSV